MLSEKDLNKIKLLKAQNDGLKIQNKDLQRENVELKEKIKKYAAINEQETKDYAELKAENERLKTQYNCYACGNCKGKEDYINLEKHHKGLRKQFDKKVQTLQEIKAIAEPFAKCYTHTCRNCEKYDNAHACCLKDIHCYKYNDGSKSSCKDFVLPTKQFYEQILANVITQITKAEEE